MYAILEQAVRGSALSYLIFRHEAKTDGHGAWKELIKHYHGSEQQYATLATQVTDKLIATKFIDGGELIDYINTFDILRRELQEIPENGMGERIAKQQFITNIKHPDYKEFKSTLQHNMNTRSLSLMMDDLTATSCL